MTLQPRDTALGTLTLMGSGEFLEPMAKIHRGLLERHASEVHAVFLDTPAGFELNCDQIAQRAIQYFAQRFDVPLEVVSYRTPDASAMEISEALRHLSPANYIVAGPGSPTYAIRTLRGSAVWDGVVERFHNGASLVMASAAALSVGRLSVPVYEVYRCGEEPKWIDGLDLLGPVGLNVAVIPHWDNTSGTGFDTRYCFMGEGRMQALERMLPAGTVILGVDEHTACTFDFKSGQCKVEGAGSVTVQRDGRLARHESGATFGFEELRAGQTSQTTAPAPPTPAATGPRPLIARYLEELAEALSADPTPDDMARLIEVIHEAAHEMASDPHGADSGDGPDTRLLLDLLEKARVELRAAKRFEVSDEIRDRLAEAGIKPQDQALKQ